MGPAASVSSEARGPVLGKLRAGIGMEEEAAEPQRAEPGLFLRPGRRLFLLVSQVQLQAAKESPSPRIWNKFLVTPTAPHPRLYRGSFEVFSRLFSLYFHFCCERLGSTQTQVLGSAQVTEE